MYIYIYILLRDSEKYSFDVAETEPPDMSRHARACRGVPTRPLGLVAALFREKINLPE